ncbi:tyrosine integrase [Gordonia phage Horus]|uniref:Integrase n=1 Tax=Gordonia phage Horus TaxID=2301696 RepID=A0A385DWJ7_9CAUD|nr:integrase [Gordonia phage Horus]AXQ63900.1 tyrosine integrase [Gordonia phage Horus]WNM69757.1 tyrosine integrase [Gordonia phage Crater]
MASLYTRVRSDGTEFYKVQWRHEGRQRALTFDSLTAAERHRLNVEKFGHERAMTILGVVETHRNETTLTQAAEHHIDALIGVEPGTIKRYKAIVARDFASIGPLPLSEITEPVIAAWIRELEGRGNSGKTIANKHGLLSAVLGRAVRESKLVQNPCEHTRLPRKDPLEEPVFLSRDEWDALYEAMPAQWQPLTQWLVTTGMRFSEATALTVGDIDGSLCRISKAWKWTGTKDSRLAYPKSKAGRRTINLPAQALAVIDLDRPKKTLLFTNANGDRVTYSRYYDGGWKPAMEKAPVRCSPHDLRHTCASWMIAAGVPLPVIQAHLGHESITVTVGVYGHLDRSSHAQAADAISAAMEKKDVGSATA